MSAPGAAADVVGGAGRVMRTRALVASGPNAPLEVAEIELPEVGPDEVLVDVSAAGVCHSDLSMIDGTFAPEFPLVLGHEASGVVTSVGSVVNKVAVGDRVVLNWAPACRTCWFCTHGEPWLCANAGMPSRPRGSLGDGTPLHVTLGLGALAERVVAGQDAVVPVPSRLPAESAALLGCAVLTGFGAVTRTSPVPAGATVAVVGLGGVGLSVVAAASAAHASAVIAIDVNESKRALAMSAGATGFVVTDESLTKAVRSSTDGLGVDFAFDCVGRAATIGSTWRLTRRGGTCTVVGIGPRDDMVEFSAAQLFHSARTLRSSVYGSSDPDVDLPGLAQLVLDGSLDLGPMVSHRVTLDDAAAAFVRMRSGEGARTLVLP